MTESSSAGNPDGAILPADHPLGPAVPIPPREKEAERIDDLLEHGAGAGSTADDAHGDSAPAARDAQSGQDGGRPHAERREGVLDPSAGAGGHRAATIRDEQGTHSAGTVPAAFNGKGSPEDPAENRHPEDAAAEPDTWDSGGARG